MKYSDTQLLEWIRSGDPKLRDWALYNLLIEPSLKGLVIGHVRQHGGNEQDGEDVFSETLVIFDRKAQEVGFHLSATLRTFLFAIAKWHWLGRLRRKKLLFGEFPTELPDDETEGVEARIFEGERRKLLDLAIAELDPRCQELLKHQKLSNDMKEISELFGFSSPEMAKKQSYRCRNKLREVFDKHPHLLEALNIRKKNG